MRIEIMVENEDYQIFPLNKPKITIGSQDNCDIVLQVDGVSRKHLVLTCENDKFFVVDQGSTNGTFINEERLVPGRVFEFTSFFPMRLGDKVLITLLSEEDESDLQSSLSEYNESTSESETSEATRAISLKDLHSAKTETLVKKRQESVIRRNTQQRVPKKQISDKSRMRLLSVVSVVIVSGAFALSYLSKDEETPVEKPVYKVQKVVEKIPESRFALVKKSDLPKFETITELQKNTPCLNDLEKYLCEQLPVSYVTAIQEGTMVFAYLDGNEFYVKAKESFPAPVAPEGETVPDTVLKAYRDDLVYSSFVFFLTNAFPKKFDFEKYQGINLTFVLEIDTSPTEKTFAIVSVVPDSLKQLLAIMEPRHLETAMKYGADSLHFYKDYFVFSTNKREYSSVQTDTAIAPDPLKESSKTQSAPASEPENKSPSRP